MEKARLLKPDDKALNEIEEEETEDDSNGDNGDSTKWFVMIPKTKPHALRGIGIAVLQYF